MLNKISRQGYTAFWDGVITNPYPDNHKNFERHRDWLYGWNKAYYENMNGKDGTDTID